MTCPWCDDDPAASTYGTWSGVLPLSLSGNEAPPSRGGKKYRFSKPSGTTLPEPEPGPRWSYRAIPIIAGLCVLSFGLGFLVGAGYL